MKNILGDTAAIVVLIIMVGVVAALFLSSADGNVQTRLKDKTVDYVDSARAMGKLTPAAYVAYRQSVSNCGEFEPQIKVVRSVSYIKDGEVTTDMVTIAESEILAYMFPDGGSDKEFILNTNDRVYACVRRTGAGFTSLAGLFGQGGHEGDLICEYSGLTLHDGNAVR